MLYIHFHLVQNILKFSLKLFFALRLLRSVLISKFWGDFPDIFVLLLWSENLLHILIILNLLKLILWHKIWSIFDEWSTFT